MKTSTKLSPKSLMCLHLIFTSKHFPLNVVILDIFIIKKKKSCTLVTFQQHICVTQTHHLSNKRFKSSSLSFYIIQCFCDVLQGGISGDGNVLCKHFKISIYYQTF